MGGGGKQWSLTNGCTVRAMGILTKRASKDVLVVFLRTCVLGFLRSCVLARDGSMLKVLCETIDGGYRWLVEDATLDGSGSSLSPRGKHTVQSEMEDRGNSVRWMHYSLFGIVVQTAKVRVPGAVWYALRWYVV